MSPAGSGQSIAVDASALVAMLVDGGPAGQWVIDQCRDRRLTAPTLLPYEVGNVLRRQARAGRISIERAAAAHQTVANIQAELWPFGLLAGRIWQLRDVLSGYDAAYCAVAELTGAPLITLDKKLAHAVGPTAEIRTFGAN